jgi:hypothetical protein
LAALRQPRPALQLVNLSDAMCLFVQSGAPFLPALEFQGQLGSALKQPRNLIGQISSLVMDWDC